MIVKIEPREFMDLPLWDKETSLKAPIGSRFRYYFYGIWLATITERGVSMDSIKFIY